MNFFIHSYLWLLEQQTWKCKRKLSCANSRIHLLLPSIFETLGQKLKVLLRIFCSTKITLEWIPPPPLLCLTRPLICKFFCPPPAPPLFSTLKSPYSHLPICNWEGGSNYPNCFKCTGELNKKFMAVSFLHLHCTEKSHFWPIILLISSKSDCLIVEWQDETSVEKLQDNPAIKGPSN